MAWFTVFQVNIIAFWLGLNEITRLMYDLRSCMSLFFMSLFYRSHVSHVFINLYLSK